MLTFKFKSLLMGGACAVCLAPPAAAESFNIPGGDLESALNTYVTQTGVHLIVSEDAIKGVHSRGVKGDLPAEQALSRILAGSGFTVRNSPACWLLSVVANPAMRPKYCNLCNSLRPYPYRAPPSKP